MVTIDSPTTVLVQPGQIRAARALLGWTQSEAARACRVGSATLARLERGERVPGSRTLDDIVAAFQSHGISFFADELECGVALRNRRNTEPEAARI